MAVQTGSQPSPPEKQYLAVLEDVLGNDPITDAGLNMLRRCRERLGLSDETVASLEVPFFSTRNITIEERQYLDDVADCADDGGISDHKRRMLNRNANRLGLSDTRAAEPEHLFPEGPNSNDA